MGRKNHFFVSAKLALKMARYQWGTIQQELVLENCMKHKKEVQDA
jgi:hypothetical protein